MNRNVLWTNPERVDPEQVLRMNSFWGDESWYNAAYVEQPGLFGDIPEKTSNEEIAAAFRERLLEVAGFSFVPTPIPMRNSRNAVVYYLFFASHNRTGQRIVDHIFNKYRDRRTP